jgi:hypothetical protein
MPTSRIIFVAFFLFALSPLGATPSFADGTSIAVTKADIAAYKAALKLTPIQQVYWVPVAAALKALPAEGNSINVDAQSFGRLKHLLRPLFASLDEDQKRVALAIAQRLGFAQFASAI